MAANSPESRPTTREDDNGSIAPFEGRSTVHNAGSGVADNRSKIDTRFATFLAEEAPNLANTLEERAKEHVGVTSLKWYEGAWSNKTKWHRVAPDKPKDKRVYKAHRYTDDKGRPRRQVKTQPYPTGDTNTLKDLQTTSQEYEAWRINRLAEEGRLSAAERQEREDERAARREAERQEREKLEAERWERQLRQNQEAEEKAAREQENGTRQIAHHETFEPVTAKTQNLYLAKKKIEGLAMHDVRHDGRNLSAAVRDLKTLEIMNLQTTAPDGSKLFLKGMPIKGGAIFPNGIPPEDAKKVMIGEGLASAASGYMAHEDDEPKTYFVAALTAGNLEAVCKAIRERCPNAAITLISDNDANPFTKDGKPKENVGQKKAHTLALEFKLKVVVPRIAGKEHENVDLNDVLVECGPEAVRRQLADARHTDPHYAVPDGEGAAFLRCYELAQDYGCTVIHNRGRYLDPLELLRGITTLCGAMGTGKTEAVEKLVKGHPDLTVLALSHLQGLTGSLAKRLGLTDYRTITQGRERKFRRAAYCINSLWRLIDSQVGLIQTFDMVFLDEIEQLLRRLTSRKNFRRKRQCLDALEHIVRSARHVIAADAHLGHTTMRWLKRLRPQDRPHMVLGSYTPGTGRKVYKHERRGDVRAAARDALLAGKHVYYATNGLERAHEVNGWFDELKAQMPELKTLLVCSDTAGEEPVKAFFRDPSAESRNYGLIVASPSVSTGVSIKAGHFGVACGEFGTRVGTPNDALQALSRVRECPILHVYVETRSANLTTDPALIRAGFWTKPGDDVEMSAGCDFKTNRLLIQANYAALYEDVKSAERAAINAYTDNFWELVREDGYTIESGRPAPDARTIEKQANESAKALRKANLLEAPGLNESEARELSEARRRGDATSADVAALERHNLVSFYRLEDPAGELPDLIDADRRGDLRREVERLELTASDPSAARDKIREQEQMDKLPPDFERYDLQHHAYSTTLRAAGLDLTTLTTSGRRYTAEELLETWVKPLEAVWHSYENKVTAWPELKYAKEQPIKALGGVLKGAFGLKHHRIGKAEGGAYTLKDEPLEERRAWIAKREQIISYIKNHNGTSVPAAHVPALSLPAAPLDDAGEPSAPQTAADDTRTTPRKPFGYEALRFQVLGSDPGPRRDLLLESFSYADDGDEQATADLTGYLRKPEVQAMIGAAA